MAKHALSILFLLAVILAAWIRFDNLGIKPLHHDEGVNAFFLTNLDNSGSYKYNPDNYHGPSIYYLAWPALKVFGDTDFALRFIPALFGVLTVILLWFLRKELGDIGTVITAYFLALSPGLVYFSRDFIHEILFGCATVGIVVGVIRYLDSKQFRWMILLSISTALLVTSKETAIINIGVLIIAFVCALIWSTVWSRKLPDILNNFPPLDHILSAIILFIFIFLTLYSSFFTNLRGPADFFISISKWSNRTHEHGHPFPYYFGILCKFELPLVIGSIVGGGITILRARTIFPLFAGAWALGLFLAYSLIPYKTPWIAINFMIPMAIMTGYAANSIWELVHQQRLSYRTNRGLLTLGVISLAIILSQFGRLCYSVNFYNYDDNLNQSGYFFEYGKKKKWTAYTDTQYGYVYAQTDRDIFRLLKDLKTEVDKFPTKDNTGIYIASPDYWPLPWYLSKYNKAVFSGKLDIGADIKPSTSQPIVIAGEGQQTDLIELRGEKNNGSPYTLRPGVQLFIYNLSRRNHETF